jgi:NTP pyrophosphatase (non-canonical NTP hydrolase)
MSTVIFFDELRLKSLSNADKDVPLYQKIIKLQEEIGEVAQEFLAFDGAKNASKSAKGDKLLEEVIDVLIVAKDIINAMADKSSTPVDEIVELCNTKLDKWYNKTLKYNNIESCNSEEHY